MSVRVAGRIGKGCGTCQLTFSNRLGNLSDCDGYPFGSTVVTFWGESGEKMGTLDLVRCCIWQGRRCLFSSVFIEKVERISAFRDISVRKSQTMEICVPIDFCNRQMLGFFRSYSSEGRDFCFRKRKNVLFFIFISFHEISILLPASGCWDTGTCSADSLRAGRATV